MIIKIKKLIDKIKKYLNEHKKVALAIMIGLAVVVIVIFIIIKGTEDKKVEEDDGLNQTNYLSEVSSPQITTPETVQEEHNDGFYYNYQSGYKFKIPDGYEVLESDGNVYLRNKNGNQIVVYKTDDKFSDVMYLCDSMGKAVRRMNILVDGEEKGVSNYGEEAKEVKSVGPYDKVKYEVGEVWCFTNKTGTTKIPEASYYTLMPDSTGVILMATNKNSSPEVLFLEMDKVLSTLEPYTPSEEERNQALTLTTYKSPKADENEIAYPSDWEIQKNADGMMYAKAPENTTNVYSGVIIEYFADDRNAYVSDFAQFSGNYEFQLMAPTFTQNVSPEDFDIEKSVKSMDRNAKIGAKDCYKFDIMTTLYPYSMGVMNSMGANKQHQNSIRYCFESHGVPCVLNFITNGNDCSSLIENILNQSIIY